MKIYKFRDKARKCHHRFNTCRETNRCTPFNCPYIDDCVIDTSYMEDKFKDSVVKEIAKCEVNK